MVDGDSLGSLMRRLIQRALAGSSRMLVKLLPKCQILKRYISRRYATKTCTFCDPHVTTNEYMATMCCVEIIYGLGSNKDG